MTSLPALLRWFIVITILATPLYMVRFSLFGVPTNVLETLIITSLILSMAVGGGIRAWWQTIWRDRTMRRIITAFALLLIGALLSTATGSAWRVGLGIIKGWFVLPFFFALSVYVGITRGTLSRELLFRTLIASGALITLISIIYAALDIFTYDHRLCAFYLSPNYLAMIIAPTLPLTIAGFLCADTFQKQFFTGGTLLLLIATLFLTRSFGGILAGSVGVLFFLSRTASTRTLLRGTIIIIAFCIIAIALLWHTPRVQDFFSTPERSSLASRLIIWRTAWDIGTDHPFFGIGPGHFQDIYLSYQKYYKPYLEWAVPQPHNLYLAFWLQTGIIGLSGLALLFVALIKSATKNLRSTSQNPYINYAIISALIVILFHGLIDTTYWKNDLSMIFWLLVIITIAKKQKLLIHQK